MVIVGITGKRQTGKTTLAKFLTDYHGFTQRSFATPLKEMLNGLRLKGEHGNLINFHKLSGAQKEREIPGINLTPRQLLQHFGTEGGRALSPDFWVKIDLMNADYEAPRVVYDDVRFDSEAQYIKDRGGIIIKTDNPQPKEIQELNNDAFSHSSEQGINLDLVDFIYRFGKEEEIAMNVLTLVNK